MTVFVPGQRFISEAEPELGLGQIVEVSGRNITVEFQAAATTRLYAIANAPLTRIRFDAGDKVQDRKGTHCTVLAVNEKAGLLQYEVNGTNPNTSRLLPETELFPHLSLSQPLKRLLVGQVENLSWYQLRLAALKVLAFIESSPLLGLCSGRTELLPHQLYIAHTVATRPAPRVLLSDEVGLGKTIEACLILQQQLLSGLANRVLILVPDSLVHQWLVELLRRFNLRFTILDHERCVAITEVNPVNPFETEQHVLCSRDLLRLHPEWRQAALAAGWDLLIVDEAHHLLVQESAESEPAAGIYEIVRSFAEVVPGLLLLTATPDQLGLQSHFGLLQLLDSQRFHNFDSFVAEQQHYIEVASLLDQLVNIGSLSQAERATLITRLLAFASDDQLKSMLQELAAETTQDLVEKKAREVLDALLDRHGTGRIVYRNSRRNISGFPERKLHTYPLQLPALYETSASQLNPEQEVTFKTTWLKDDPRVEWLNELLKENRQQKFLLICQRRATAQALEEFMRLNRGVRSAVFHEGLSLIERDRAAAYFAEHEAGAQLLVCSEIGSEGRNFQFSQNLVLFDLPRNPDLLEQRIGRLDRIGQHHTVNIHLPYFAGTSQEVLMQFFANSLEIFARPNPVAAQVCKLLEQELEQTMQQPGELELRAKLLAHSKQLNEELLREHVLGRDRLLELNSCRPAIAQSLLQQVTELEHQDSPAAFLQQVFASYGLDSEENTNHTWSVMPGDDMLIESFPQIPDDGMTFTLDRQLALVRDDVPFVNWLHPLVLQSLDMILQDNHGKCCVGTLRDKRLVSGSLVLESIYRVNVSAPPRLQAKRFFPTSTLRTVVDSQKRSLGKALPAEFLDSRMQTMDKTEVSNLVTDKKAVLQLLSKLSQQVAEKLLPDLCTSHTGAMQARLDTEIQRLQALKAVNPQVQDNEIIYLQQQRENLTQAFASARLQLEALRLFIVL
ncbi:MAG: RNA polymerase-associated protein RapA [Pseudomonadota bacterium]